MAWAITTTNHLDSVLFTVLARAAGRPVSEFSAQGLANMAWALAN